jgi:hypothetical protein
VSAGNADIKWSASGTPSISKLISSGSAEIEKTASGRLRLVQRLTFGLLVGHRA